MPHTSQPAHRRRERAVRSTSPALRTGKRVRPAVWLGVAVLTLLLVAVAYSLYTYFNMSRKMAPAAETRDAIESVLDKPSPPSGDGERFTYVLLLGNDRRPGQSRARSDTILLARLNSQDKSVLLLSIPRDTRTEVPGYGLTKINHAAAYGGVPLTIQTVKDFTGLPVHHYVLIDFEGFGSVVDALGGVEMMVDRPARIPGGRTIAPGFQLLDGDAALAVVRNRKAYADGDFARIRAQQAFLSAMAKRASQPGNATRIPSVIDSAAQHVETDMSIREMTGMVMDYRAAAAGDMLSYTVPAGTGMIDGVSYVLPDEAKAEALFAAIGRGETPAEGSSAK